ncbi:sulfatase-like hydrolase/transferase [Rhodobacteraceae bacterium F11138]|nr:sulfatase-like hydrolase/transferase [Rhodobacteraceae bacterium F11138]
MTSLRSARMLLGASCMFALQFHGVSAQEGRPGVTAPQLSLPYAEQKYRGDVGTTYLDSDPAQFPLQVAAPEGAPNVLVVMLDDVGFGQFSVSGGGVPSPHMEALAEDGYLFTRFHTTAV